MNLSTLAGNQRIKDRLSRREWDRGLSHAYIISGPAGSGRHALARRLAAAMLCTGGGERPCGTCPACLKTEKGIHPDFSVTAGPEAGKPITVDQVRALRSDAYIRPNEGERKVYLLEEADRMNPSAQNAMLKLLEEGPALDPEQLEQAERLAAALERAGELELLETALSVLDVKRSREELSAFLGALERALGARAVRGGERRRLMHAVDLVNRLRDAARLNVSAGQLSGWLCCGMFGQER